MAGRNASPQTVDSIRQQLGLRPAAADPIPALSLGPVAGRHGTVLPPADGGGRADHEPAAGDPAADGRRDLLRVGGSACRSAVLAAVKSRSARRPGADGGQFRGRLGAAVRGRHPAALRLRAQLHWFPPCAATARWSTWCCRAVTLGILGGGWYSRMMRSSMIDVLRQGLHPHGTRQGGGPRADRSWSTPCATPSCR